DLEVVVRRVREGAFAIAVAQRPHLRVAGTKRYVNLNIAALVGGDARGLEAEIVGVGNAADREKNVRAARFGLTFLTLDADRDPFAVLLHGEAFGAQTHRDAFVFE